MLSSWTRSEISSINGSNSSLIYNVKINNIFIVTLFGVIIIRQTKKRIKVKIIILNTLHFFVNFIFSQIISEGGGACEIVQS